MFQLILFQWNHENLHWSEFFVSSLTIIFLFGPFFINPRQNRCLKSIIFVLTCSFRIINKFRFALFAMMIIKIIPSTRGHIVNKIIISSILGFPLTWTLSDPGFLRRWLADFRWLFNWCWNGTERVSFALSRCLRCLKIWVN